MNKDVRIRQLEAEVARLKIQEKKLLQNAAIFRQIFAQLNKQFEELKKDMKR